MIELALQGDDILLPVQAQPRARRAGIVGIHAGRLKVAVTEAPEKGKANDAVIDVLVESLRLRPAQIELTRGASSTKKVFRVTGIAPTEMQQRIAAVVGPGD